MTRTFGDARRWMRAGTRVLLDAASTLDEAAQRQPSGLPGWNRKSLLAHVAANADALRNLVHWAATGEETPMYASPEARTAGIESGSGLPAADLLAWLRSSAEKLDDAMASLTEEQWQTKVVTAQGRTVPATETPWMRGREVFVHTVDLGNGVTFADLPSDFLEALKIDIIDKRARSGENVPDVRGALPDVTAYLAGRPHGRVTLVGGAPAPELGPWI
ncbi:maleylpyruvate isomerase family mycothiol-dependent enzyme [Thermopolyspora sp. NPDC052614]|uniref:maleylpyruvate isomerase family mycothiol-dependent enzyme n=1 Tax=Thermopolyspora sp. NPDC052614 TaxID=3155682 RepID=UPI00342BFA43